MIFCVDWYLLFVPDIVKLLWQLQYTNLIFLIIKGDTKWQLILKEDIS